MLFLVVVAIHGVASVVLKLGDDVVVRVGAGRVGPPQRSPSRAVVGAVDLRAVEAGIPVLTGQDSDLLEHDLLAEVHAAPVVAALGRRVEERSRVAVERRAGAGAFRAVPAGRVTNHGAGQEAAGFTGGRVGEGRSSGFVSSCSGSFSVRLAAFTKLEELLAFQISADSLRTDNDGHGVFLTVGKRTVDMIGVADITVHFPLGISARITPTADVKEVVIRGALGAEEHAQAFLTPQHRALDGDGIVAPIRIACPDGRAVLGVIIEDEAAIFDKPVICIRGVPIPVRAAEIVPSAEIGIIEFFVKENVTVHIVRYLDARIADGSAPLAEADAARPFVVRVRYVHIVVSSRGSTDGDREDHRGGQKENCDFLHGFPPLNYIFTDACLRGVTVITQTPYRHSE